MRETTTPATNEASGGSPHQKAGCTPDTAVPTTAAALAQIAQTARRNAAACLNLAERLAHQDDRAAAERLVALAEDCRSVARRAEAIGQ